MQAQAVFLESIQENPSWKILGGVLLSFYAGITLLGMYQNKEETRYSTILTPVGLQTLLKT